MPSEIRAMSGGLRVAVVMGGPSGEHDISLKSGHGVAEALAKRGWRVESIAIPKAVSLEQARGVARDALQHAAPEVVFIALHGAFGEDGTIQQVCEELHLAYTGSDVQASRLGMDKVASRRRFEAAGLHVPRWRLIDLEAAHSAALRTVVRDFPCPLVVKPPDQGSSLGVSIVRREEELAQALAHAGQYGPHVLIEEFVSGREMTVGVLGDDPLPIVEIRPTQPFFDFTAKYTVGMTEYVVPAPLAPDAAQRVQAAGLVAHRALGCRHLSRTDMIVRHDGVPVVLEVNTIPGFTPTSLVPKAAACLHIAYEELCERLALMAVQSPAHV